jgi:hypothetical protein
MGYLPRRRLSNGKRERAFFSVVDGVLPQPPGDEGQRQRSEVPFDLLLVKTEVRRDEHLCPRLA